MFANWDSSGVALLLSEKSNRVRSNTESDSVITLNSGPDNIPPRDDLTNRCVGSCETTRRPPGYLVSDKKIKHLDSKDNQVFEILGEIKRELATINEEVGGVKEANSIAALNEKIYKYIVKLCKPRVI